MEMLQRPAMGILNVHDAVRVGRVPRVAVLRLFTEWAVHFWSHIRLSLGGACHWVWFIPRGFFGAPAVTVVPGPVRLFGCRRVLPRVPCVRAPPAGSPPSVPRRHLQWERTAVSVSQKGLRRIWENCESPQASITRPTGPFQSHICRHMCGETAGWGRGTRQGRRDKA